MASAKLDTKTWIPMGWAFVLLSCSGSALIFTGGVALYAGRVEGKAEAASKAVEEIKASANHRDDVLRTIDQRLSHIEGALGVSEGPRLAPVTPRRR
jgi:hypothetical protein